MELKNKIALLRAMWTQVQAELSTEYEGNERFESASDDITFAIFELSTIAK